MVDEQRQSDIVDRAFEAMRKSEPPEGPTMQAMEQALHLLRQAQEKPQTHRLSFVERIRKMNKLIKYPIAAAIALALLAGGTYLLLGPSAGNAFAEVRQQIEQAKTMTLMARTETTSGTMTIKMYFKSPGKIRQETMMPAPASATGSQPASAPGPMAISIFDIAELKSVTLLLQQKKAIVYEMRNVPPAMVENARQQNFLDELKKNLAGKHEDLGEKTIDGRKVRGYRLVTKVGASDATMDLWADASSGAPVLMEETLPEGMGKIIMTDFVINPRLDDSLFDTKVPEGYEVETQKVDLKIDDEDIARLLGFLAKYGGDVFPKTLTVTPELIKRMEKNIPPMEESKEFSMLLTKVTVFQITTPQSGGEFVYAGEGVKLGDKNTPILWYKKKEETKYHIIYGDLRIEMADKTPAAPASRPSTKP